jgi:hypothetical protein
MPIILFPADFCTLHEDGRNHASQQAASDVKPPSTWVYYVADYPWYPVSHAASLSPHLSIPGTSAFFVDVKSGTRKNKSSDEGLSTLESRGNKIQLKM